MIESAEIGCGICEHRNYDSFHDESWCGHDPEPDGLCPRLLVEHTDKCAYFTCFSLAENGKEFKKSENK